MIAASLFLLPLLAAAQSSNSTSTVLNVYLGYPADYLLGSIVGVTGTTTTLAVGCDTAALSSLDVSCDAGPPQTYTLGGTTAVALTFSDPGLQYSITCNYTSARMPNTATRATPTSTGFAGIPTFSTATGTSHLHARQVTASPSGGPYAVCIQSIDGSEANDHGVTTTTLDPTNVELTPVTITAGAEKLPTTTAGRASSGAGGASASGSASPSSKPNAASSSIVASGWAWTLALGAAGLLVSAI